MLFKAMPIFQNDHLFPVQGDTASSLAEMLRGAAVT